MKVSRIIALSLLVLLGGTTIVAVCLHAQAPAPRNNPRATEPASPNSFVPIEIGGPPQLPPANRTQFYFGASDSKAVQLINAEQAADQEARTLAAQYAQAATEEQRADFKKKLREKLAAIFEMQQKRRTAEIAGIEERLAKLKDVSKKRETNKDPIVDRRLEQLTGGVDELGWEDSNRGAIRHSAGQQGGYYFEPNSNGGNALNIYEAPVFVPRPDNNVPALEPGSLSPVPAVPPAPKLPSQR